LISVLKLPHLVYLTDAFVCFWTIAFFHMFYALSVFLFSSIVLSYLISSNLSLHQILQLGFETIG